MDSIIISLVAQTHIHAGVGQSTGALDLPVARERATHFPFVPGSGVKGAFRVWATDVAKLGNVAQLFGVETSNDNPDDGGAGAAGNLLCSDARLLLLPVRCLSDAFKWVTCPALLKRFANDCARAGQSVATTNNIMTKGYFGVDTSDVKLGLEEREFDREGDVDGETITALSKIVDEAELKQRLVIVSDKDFVWFARYALPVMARNALDENKIVKSGALWYEESLAPDTVMYLLFGERKASAVSDIESAISDNKYIQMGGNETIGQGWFKMQVCGGLENG